MNRVTSCPFTKCRGRGNLYGCPGIYFDSHVPRSSDPFILRLPRRVYFGWLVDVIRFAGILFEVFQLIEFFNFVPRIWGMACENLVLVAVPAFVYMGVMLERSGIANDLLYCVQVLLRKVPGALALAVTVMGTILAAMTGIIGASVTMMTALALPTMMRQGYSHALSTGVIAASGTLGILIPPSIMLIIMADLMAISVGNVFMAAIVPGLTLSAFYLIYVATLAAVKPSLAPPLPANLLNIPKGEMTPLVNKSLFLQFYIADQGPNSFGFANRLKLLLALLSDASRSSTKGFPGKLLFHSQHLRQTVSTSFSL